jgi:hypothetical protein
MLARLLLALLLLFQAMPVAAAPACHPAPAMTEHHQPKHHPAPADQAAPEQHCIGCIAPATARAPELVLPMAFARADAPPVYLSGAKGIAPAPALPPPRSGS